MYLLFESYQDLGGKADVATFSRLEFLARATINRLTRNRVKDIPVPLIQDVDIFITPLQMLTFELIELYLKNNATTTEQNIISMQNNGVSISYAVATSEEMANKEYELVKTYLQDVTANDGNSVLWLGV